MTLRESDCSPTDMMDILNTFPAMETLFFQSHIERDTISRGLARLSFANQMVTIPSKKPCLSDTFEKMKSLKALVLVPLNGKFQSPDMMRDFLGPFRFLRLTALPELTSVSALINLFAAPDGETTGVLTVSPTKVLPRSLTSLHITVDLHSISSWVDPTPLNEVWFQPREAALEFLDELASICALAFPGLRQVEYIWAVDRAHNDKCESTLLTLHAIRHPMRPEPERLTTPCDGSVPLCCYMHTRIQAMSPDEDYTSRAEGIVSPFKQRFEDLEAAFKQVSVAFKVTELKRYSDYYLHWRRGRE